MANFSCNSTVQSFPRLPYQQMKEDILGKAYQLDLTFVGEKRAAKLNHKYRGMDYIPNVLSFPLADNGGEIYITPTVAKRQAVDHDMSYRGFVGYLFIHGLLHLKGYGHGATMTKAEDRYKKKYRLS